MRHSADDVVRADALFVSHLQASERVTEETVRATVDSVLDRHGARGCAALVAYEYGEHPDTAPGRMAWARRLARRVFARATLGTA